MTIALSILVVVLFVLAFMGTVVPVIPDAPLFLGALLIYHFFINDGALGAFFWFFAVGISVLVFVMDYVASGYAAKKYGASKYSLIGVIIGILIFPIFLGPFGIIIGPFVMVLLIERMRGTDWQQAMKIGVATVIGFLSGSVVKIILLVFILVWFLIAIF